MKASLIFFKGAFLLYIPRTPMQDQRKKSIAKNAMNLPMPAGRPKRAQSNTMPLATFAKTLRPLRY